MIKEEDILIEESEKSESAYCPYCVIKMKKSIVSGCKISYCKKCRKIFPAGILTGLNREDVIQ